MTAQGVFHPEARILARAHGVQLMAHGVYSLALWVCQHPLRRELWHEEMQVVELQSEFIGQWRDTEVPQIVYLCLWGCGESRQDLIEFVYHLVWLLYHGSLSTLSYRTISDTPPTPLATRQ